MIKKRLKTSNALETRSISVKHPLWPLTRQTIDILGPIYSTKNVASLCPPGISGFKCDQMRGSSILDVIHSEGAIGIG